LGGLPSGRSASSILDSTISPSSDNSLPSINEALLFTSTIGPLSHVRWVPCHHSMACPQVANGGNTLQVWRVAVNILNKQSRTADKGWPSSLGVGRGANSILRYRSLGYRYKQSGELEDQYRFLKRMSGIMRLYAAILISQPCRYQQKKSHPHGLAQAWRWIACMVNLAKFPQYNTHAEIN
jgi:hypothetical protein